MTITALYIEVSHYLDFAPEGYAEPMEVSALVSQVTSINRPATFTQLREIVSTFLSARGFLDAAIDSVSGTFYDYNFTHTYSQEDAA